MIDLADYKRCLGCITVLAIDELRDGRCPLCHGKWLDNRESILAKADERALSKAAREILLGVSQAGRGEPQSPEFISAAMAKLGGVHQFAGMVVDDYHRSRGCSPDGQPLQGVKTSPQMSFKIAELLARIMLKNDERESLEVGSLSDKDLVDTLRALITDLVQNDPAYRELIVMECLRIQPDLIHKAMNAAGTPVVDGTTAPVEKPNPIELSEAGLDEIDAGEDDDD